MGHKEALRRAVEQAEQRCNALAEESARRVWQAEAEQQMPYYANQKLMHSLATSCLDAPPWDQRFGARTMMCANAQMHPSLREYFDNPSPRWTQRPHQQWRVAPTNDYAARLLEGPDR